MSDLNNNILNNKIIAYQNYMRKYVSKYPIHCILAVDINFGIATNNKIPWKITEDLKYFKNVTSSSIFKQNIIIMGKNTWESIGSKPLAERINIIISSTMTSKSTYDPTNKNDYLVMNNVTKAIEISNEFDNIENIFIVGGKRLYDEFINSGDIDNIYLTKINHDYQTDTKININVDNFDIVTNNKLILKCLNKNIDVDVNFMKLELKKNKEEIQYLSLLSDIITNGDYRQTRNDYTKSLFSNSLKFDLSKSFPLITTKKMFLRGIFEELKFFLLGQTNTKILENNKVNIWKSNTNRQFLDSVGLVDYVEGDMGPMYGFQLRHFDAEYKGCNFDYDGMGVDQLQNIINLIKSDRYSRRIIMTTYNPKQVKSGVLPPCHGIVIQFAIDHDNKLSCHTYQRSADFFHGIPFNIASYALLVHIICEIVNNSEPYDNNNKITPGNLTIALGDYHVYQPHFEIVSEQLKRTPYLFPTLKINKKISSVEELNNLEFVDIELLNYQCYPTLKADMIA